LPDTFKNKYRIASIRLQKWDYGWNGSYFITICTRGRQCFFGKIINRSMLLSAIGEIAEKFWFTIPDHFPFIKLDAFVVMPNHVHGIIIIDKKNGEKNVGAGAVETRHCLVSTTPSPRSLASPKTIGQKRFQNPGKNNLSSIIGSYKSVVSKHAHKINAEFEWQERFYDHIIRDYRSFKNIRNYIKRNPENWNRDTFF